jgi:hypothetical protein
MLCRFVAVISLLALVIGCDNSTQTRVIQKSTVTTIERSTYSENEFMACGKPWFHQVSSKGDQVTIEWGCPVTNKMNIVRNMYVRGLLMDKNDGVVVDSVAMKMVDPGKTEDVKREVDLTKEQAARIVGIGVQANNQ